MNIQEENKIPMMVIATVISVAGSAVTLTQAVDIKKQGFIIGLVLLSWLITFSIIFYNKLQGIQRKVEKPQPQASLGQYIFIDGEEDAFAALIPATLRGRKHVRSTRFFPHPISGNQPNYAEAIRKRVMGTDGEPPLNHYSRIICVNNREKLRDIRQYLHEFHGQHFTLYLTPYRNSFELVIIDDKEVFVHFFGKDSVIDSTLHIPGKEIAVRFRDVFDRLHDPRIYPDILKLDLHYVKEPDIPAKLKEVEDYFDKHCPNEAA